MKARVHKEGNFWIGEVCGEWTIFFGNYSRIGWKRVTEKCFTRTGAKIGLKKWAMNHRIFEVEI